MTAPRFCAHCGQSLTQPQGWQKVPQGAPLVEFEGVAEPMPEVPESMTGRYVLIAILAGFMGWLIYQIQSGGI